MTQAQVETTTGYVLAVGHFPGGVPPAPGIEVVDLTPEQEAVILSETPGQRVIESDGSVTIIPPPAPPIVFSGEQPLEGQVRTLDATPTEIVRLSLQPQTGYTGQVNIIGVDNGNGAVRVIRASFAVKRLNAGALSVGGPVVVASHADGGATAWTVTQNVSGSDVVVNITGAAGRTIDWLARGQIMSFAPGGI